MPSNNLRNNELEFTPTLGTQLYNDIQQRGELRFNVKNT